MSASANKKHVSIQDDDGYGDAQLMPLHDTTYSSYDSNITDDSAAEEASEAQAFAEKLRPSQLKEARAAERLSIRLLAVDDDDSEEEDRVLRQSLRLLDASVGDEDEDEGRGARSAARSSRIYKKMLDETLEESNRKARWSLLSMLALAVIGVITAVVAFYVGSRVIGPPNQPTGPYELIERQEGHDFFNYYTYYEGPDSAGSNGYQMYVSERSATDLGIVNVTYEKDILDDYDLRRQRRRKLEGNSSNSSDTRASSNSSRTTKDEKEKPFIYMGSSSTADGPRNSIRLEGNRRFNRGLFIIDLRHMPAGCGTWPAFWLTDEANWPVNGEIDIVEGVNFQSVAKTALHSTKGCSMDDIPLGTMTGEWDTATGIPNAKTGIPDKTVRYAQNCFVYDPHQWLNQGCVAGDIGGDSLGEPLNKKGGGIYALEWDPINTHIKTWVFTPHENAPENLVDAIRTASDPLEERVMPNPEQWPIPYGYFGIGDGTSCSADHFRHMRLVFNLAFCGSVSGNRFQLDCKKQAEQFDTCNEWIKSDPKEMDEAYWKIRGVYVYERQWERQWVN